MPSKYDENTKARAVRLLREHRDDYATEWAAMRAISARLGMSAETLRKWVSCTARAAARQQKPRPSTTLISRSDRTPVTRNEVCMKPGMLHNDIATLLRFIDVYVLSGHFFELSGSQGAFRVTQSPSMNPLTGTRRPAVMACPPAVPRERRDAGRTPQKWPLSLTLPARQLSAGAWRAPVGRVCCSGW